jgi:hypothetical protein
MVCSFYFYFTARTTALFSLPGRTTTSTGIAKPQNDARGGFIREGADGMECSEPLPCWMMDLLDDGRDLQYPLQVIVTT